MTVNYTSALGCSALTPADLAVEVIPNPSFHIEGLTTICQYTDNVVYTAVFDPPSPIPGHVYTYQWVVTDNGEGMTNFTGQNSSVITVDWGNGTAGQVACTVTDITTGSQLQCGTCVILPVILNPLPDPQITGCPVVAVGDVCCYEVANIPGHLYNWIIDGGEVLDCGCGYKTCVHWLTPGTHIITVCETDNVTGCSKCTTFTVTVNPGTSSLTGTVIYDNQYSTPMNDVTLNLVNTAGAIVATTTSANTNSQNGYYAFNGIAPGTYTISASYNDVWGGVNATDALIDQLVFLGLYTFDHFDSIIGNVNADNYVNPTDALWIKMRAIGMINYFPAGNWKFTNGPVIIPAGGTTFQIKGRCIGDVNKSFIPQGMKETSGIGIIDNGTMLVTPGESILYTVRSSKMSEIGAMTLFLNYDRDKIEIEELVNAPEGMKYTLNNGTLNIAWSDPNARKLAEDDAIFSLKVKVKSGIDHPAQFFSVNGGSEFAGPKAQVLDDLDLKMSSLADAGNLEFSLSNYPNPFRNTTTISYVLPEQGHVKLMLTNMFGETLRTLVDDDQDKGYYEIPVDPAYYSLASGTYLYKIVVNGVTNYFTKTNKMVFAK